MSLMKAIFCATFPITFRPATKEDFQGSVLRGKALSSFTAHEIDLSKAKDAELILTDSNNRLKIWQIEGALEHWRVIRTVLAEEIWINY
jgi:hypothetical protein